MATTLYRGLTLCGLAVLALCWVYAGAQGWLSQRAAAASDAAGPDAVTMFSGWDGEADLIRARSLMANARYEPREVTRLLNASSRYRPLYAPVWIDLAENAYRRQDPELALAYIRLARDLWPHRALLLWRIALLQIKLGRQDDALVSLADYWRANPKDTAKVMALARRLEPQPQRLLRRLFDAAPRRDIEPAFYRRQLFLFARSLGDPDFSFALWEQLPDGLRRDATYLYPLIELMLDKGRYQLAGQIWRQLYGGSDDNALHNGTFEQELLKGGLGWRANDGAGYRIERDARVVYHGAFSLHIAFDGTENVQLNGLSQIVIAEPGRHYRLTGYWRGEDISTRSGVFVQMQTLDGERRVVERNEPRWGSWRWQAFEFDLQMPEDAHLLQLSVRRRQTSALDKLLAGDVWLDDLKLVVVDRPER